MASNIHILLSENNLAPYEFKNASSVLGSINPILFGYLLRANELQELSPGLAKSWSYDFKTLTYTLVLGDHAFHNGRKLTSKDVEFSIVRGFISKAENYNRIHYSDILGIDQLQVGQKYRSGMVRGIQTPSDDIIKITLARKNPLFLLAFSIPFTPVVPKEELEDDYYTWKRYPIGAGPYRLKGAYADHKTELELVRSTSPLPKSITFHNKRREHVAYDIVFPKVTLTEQEKTYITTTSKYPASISTLFFYRGKALNENINFRKALYHGIDRTKISAEVPNSKPAFEMMVRPYGGRIHAPDPYNPKLAAEYAAKIPKTLLSKPVRIGVYSFEKSFPPEVVKRDEMVIQALKSIGIQVHFEINPEKFPSPEVIEKFDIKQMAKVVDLADPAISFGAMASISPYAKEIPDSGGEYDRRYNEALNAQTFDARIAAIEKIAELISDQALMVPLTQHYISHRYNPQTIASLGVQAQPMFLNLANIELKKPALSSHESALSQK